MKLCTFKKYGFMLKVFEYMIDYHDDTVMHMQNREIIFHN